MRHISHTYTYKYIYYIHYICILYVVYTVHLCVQRRKRCTPHTNITQSIARTRVFKVDRWVGRSRDRDVWCWELMLFSWRVCRVLLSVSNILRFFDKHARLCHDELACIGRDDHTHTHTETERFAIKYRYNKHAVAAAAALRPRLKTTTRRVVAHDRNGRAPQLCVRERGRRVWCRCVSVCLCLSILYWYSGAPCGAVQVFSGVLFFLFGLCRVDLCVRSFCVLHVLCVCLCVSDGWL